MIKGIKPSLAECGKIKIGGLGEPRLKNSARGKPPEQLTSNDYWRPPLKFDHFMVTTTSRVDGQLVQDHDIMRSLTKDSDEKVRSIPILLHSDDIDDVFQTSYAYYFGRRLACSGDGETADRYQFSPQGVRIGPPQSASCVCTKYTEENKCKPHGTLNCSIALPGHAVAGALHRWRTTSIISIQRMIGSLEQIKSVCGTLRNIPLWLKVEPVLVQPEGESSRTVYCCHVELRAADIEDVQRRALAAREMRAQLGASDVAYRALLPAPAGADEPVHEQSEVAQEFGYEDGDETGADPTPTPATSTEALKQAVVGDNPRKPAAATPVGPPEERQDPEPPAAAVAPQKETQEPKKRGRKPAKEKEKDPAPVKDPPPVEDSDADPDYGPATQGDMEF